MGRPGWIVFENRGDEPWVVLSGEVDFAVVGQFGELTLVSKHRAGHPFSVDLRDVTFLDSAAVALLIRLYNFEGRIGLVNVPDRVRRLLTVTGLTSIFGLREPSTASITS